MDTESATQNAAPAIAETDHVQTDSDSQPPVAPKSDDGGSALNPQPSTAKKKQKQRNGKVARLPKEIRDRINEMLDDGLTYPEVIAELGNDAKDLTPRCIMSWKQGGYQDYLHHQELLEQCRARQLRATHLLAHRSHINGFQATQQLAAAQICETVSDFGTDILRQALTANPLNYFRMLNCFSRLTTGGLKCERHLIDEAERKAKARRAAKPGKKGISTQSIKEMEEKLKLM